MMIRGVVAWFLVLAGSSGAAAQSIALGSLRGTVQERAGGPLFEASVTLTSRETGLARSATTDRAGVFRFSLVAPGTYDVYVESLGYRPRRIEGVPVLPGRQLEIAVEVMPAPPPVEAPEVEQFDATTLLLTRAGVSQWLPAFGIQDVPGWWRTAVEPGRLSSLSDADLASEGLPGSLSHVYLDGIPYGTIRHPALGADPLRAAALPAADLEDAELVTGSADVEWAGSAGALLSGYSRGGSRRVAGAAHGAWGSGGLWSSKYFETGGLSPRDLEGALSVSGPLVGDSAHFLIGAQARSVQAPLPAFWSGAAADALTVAAGRSGQDLSPLEQPRVARTDVVSGFGRFDWQITPNNTIDVRASYASIPTSDLPPGSREPPRPGSALQGNEASGGATLVSDLGTRFTSELRVGFDHSSRDYQTLTEVAGTTYPYAALPSTLLVAAGQAFGADPRLPGKFAESTIRASQTTHIVGDRHSVKFGVSVARTSYSYAYVFDRGTGQFTFADATRFSQLDGAFTQVVGNTPQADFSVPRYGAFVQDSWNAQPGLQVLLGLRLDNERIPAADLRSNQSWRTLTGLDNASFDQPAVKFSPRGEIDWDVQNRHRWMVHAAAGFYFDQIDPWVLSQLITDAGGLQMRRALGDLSSWPTPPTAATTLTTAPTLTLLGPKFQAPRTGRATIGTSILITPGTALHLSAMARRTDYLPRLADLNLIPTPVAHDQYGRPLFGALEQHGTLLAATPGSNRRFDAFDVVSAWNADGVSNYWGVTAAVDGSVVPSLRYLARYTYSHTTDDWLSGVPSGPPGQLISFPTGSAQQDWVDGTSDYDVPHRLVAGLELTAPYGIHLVGLYRFRSGYPFTPGFRPGVDANGDGSAGNDPAFVDAAVPGMSTLLNQWPCLRSQSGSFAARNSCRGDPVHSLDARLGLRIRTPHGLVAELYADAVNLLQSDRGRPDAALVLVDAQRSLATNASGTVTVPLVANPNFGAPLVSYDAGRLLRLGLAINW